MTEVTDIIDTAVKIGLGALITGMVTFLLADRQFKNDLKKKHIDDHKNILKEISLKIEKSESHLNETAISYTRNNYNDLDSKPIVLAVSEAYEARALTNLIGEPKLSSKIGEMTLILEEIYKLMLMPNNSRRVDEKIQMIDICKKSIYPMISKAYEKYCD